MTVIEVHDRNPGPDSQLEKSPLRLAAILSQDFRNIAQVKDSVLSK